jgi:hypothetical protein
MEKFIPVGQARFLHFLSKMEMILDEATASANPARIVYEQDLRSVLFMLEGLSRIYKKVYPHQKIKKLEKKFKHFEDLLGGLNFYDEFYKLFQDNEKIPGLVTSYTAEKAEEKLNEVNKFLIEKKWIGKKKKQLKKIYKILDKVEWFDETGDARAVALIYENEIIKVIKKFKRREEPFIDIEQDVHELRRQLRWLSIYPQALCGLVQLTAENDCPEYLKKYLTPEIVHSKFNVMPAGDALNHQIFLNRNYFYALSWMIAELGKLKDSGLELILLKEGLKKVFKVSAHSDRLAGSFRNDGQLTIAEVLQKSNNIADQFFHEKILSHLVQSTK